MASTEIKVFRGDDKTIRLNVKTSTQTPQNITGARIRFTAKTLPTSITKDSNGGAGQVAFIDAVNGIAEIYLTPSDTLGKEIGSYLYDIEMQLAGKVGTLQKGFFKVEEDVTV
jgi:hypothetical protein